MTNELILHSKNVVLAYNGVCFNEEQVIEQSLVDPFDTRTIADTAYEVRRALTLGNCSQQFAGPDRYAVIHFPEALNYWNWLTISLVRLSMLQNEGKYWTLILPDHFQHHQHVTTSLKAFEVHSITYIQYAIVGEVSELMLPRISNLTDGIWVKHLRRVAARLTSHCGKCNVHIEILYISRKSSLYRKIENELDVERILTQHGFICMTLTDLDFYEKVRLFQTIKILVCLESSDLANLLFMPAHSSVIVLRKQWTNTDDQATTSFQALAKALELEYSDLLCQPVDSEMHFIKADIRVELNELILLLKDG